MSNRLLQWYDEKHRLLPWRRNAFSKHCEPTDVVLRKKDKDTFDTKDTKTKHKEEALAYWQLDVCDKRGAARNVPLDQYAYGVWVSEIMSQQTQIERVSVYWQKWMAKWPTVSALAEATQEEVNEMWAGLGYYRRARFLLEGAKHVATKKEAKDDDGRALPTTEGKDGDELTNFPRNAKALSAVPGVGPYTAAAVASIAFNESVAAVDGNVIRVATRLSCARGGGDAAKSGTSAASAVRAVADAMLAHSDHRPGDFNQAMMELGATVCAPRNPKCSECPVAEHCQGLAAQKAASETASVLDGSVAFSVTDLPEKEKKAPKREETVAVRFVEARVSAEQFDGLETTEEIGYLLTKRKEGGLLGGLWEFPSVAAPKEDDFGSANSRGASPLLEETAAALVHSLRAFDNLPFENATVDTTEPDKYVGSVTHVFSHVRQTYHVTKATVFVSLPPKSDPNDFFKRAGRSEASPPDGTGPGTEWRWVRASDVSDAGLSSGVVKVHALVTKDPAKKTKEKKEKLVRETKWTDRKVVAARDTAIGKMFAKKRKTTEP
jgi:A/G-specific adenine glycosylase